MLMSSMNSTMLSAVNNADLITFLSATPKTRACTIVEMLSVKPLAGQKTKAYKQEAKTGHTNLRNHLKSCVGEQFEQIFIDHLCNAGGRLDNFCFNSLRDSDVFLLIEWVVMRNIPLLEVDDPITRGILNISLVPAKTIRKYIFSLIQIEEEAVK